MSICAETVCDDDAFGVESGRGEEDMPQPPPLTGFTPKTAACIVQTSQTANSVIHKHCIFALHARVLCDRACIGHASFGGDVGSD